MSLWRLLCNNIIFCDDQYIITKDDVNNMVYKQFPNLELCKEYISKDKLNNKEIGMYGKSICRYNILDLKYMKFYFSSDIGMIIEPINRKENKKYQKRLPSYIY
jgi:hypothetical protein